MIKKISFTDEFLFRDLPYCFSSSSTFQMTTQFIFDGRLDGLRSTAIEVTFGQVILFRRYNNLIFIGILFILFISV